MVRISDIQENNVIWDKVPFCHISTDEIGTYRLAKNDILFARTGGTVGKSFIVESVPFDAIYAGYLIRTRYSKLLVPLYLKSFMESSLYWEQLRNGTIATAQPNCNGKTLGRMLLPIPPQNEQYRIVEKIRLITPHIEYFTNLEEQLFNINDRLTQNITKSILQEAIQGKLVSQIASEGTAEALLGEIRAEKERLIKEKKIKRDKLDSVIFKGDDNKYYEKVGRDVVDITEEIPFEIPSTWCWCRVHTIFQLNPKNDAEDSAESAFVPMEKIAPGYGSSFIYDTVSWQQIKRGYTHFSDGDIGFAKITPCFQNRKSVIFTGLPNGIGAGTTELKILRVYDNTIDRRFALSFLKSSYFIEQATFKGTANQQRIVSGYLENKLFPLPPIKEQKRIVEQLDLLFHQLR
jgi:type I restriction enzyme S subunit